uniref:Uncharacterized protein n=1 Tax=Mus musculus TaxID=10090 RepID=Q8CDC2_MOUSE|nr:unnamed protein product [Mus musculus]
MAKFISRASTGCRRKALEGARGDRAGGCGLRKTSGYSRELARRHDAPSTSERLTDLHARPEHTGHRRRRRARSRRTPSHVTTCAAANASRPLPALMPERITGELPGRSRSEAPPPDRAPPTS